MTKTFAFQWSKRMDAAHTITLDSPDAPALGVWLRDLRRGCPWRIVDKQTGQIVRQGIGPVQ
jgi:hypothetical protein